MENRIKECQGAFRQRHVETARSNDAPRDERKVLLPTITDPRGVDFQAYERLRQTDATAAMDRRLIAASSRSAS